MAFFTSTFLSDRRKEFYNSIKRFQYQLNGGSWYDGTINSKAISGNSVVVFVNVPATGSANTITGVRVYDKNEALAGSQTISLARTGLNAALLRFTFPVTES